MKKVSLSILLVLFMLVTNIGNFFVFAVEDTVNLVSYDCKTKEESYFAVSNGTNNNKAIDESKRNIVNFFQKLFGNNKVCDCGAKH